VTTRTENDSLLEAMSRAQIPDELEPGSIYGYKLDGRVEIVDLLDRNLAQPRRKQGTVNVYDIASFATYYNKHADPYTETYVDIDAGVITAVLNAHAETENFENADDSARWQDHRVVLRLAMTDAWKAWTGKDRQLIKQTPFAEFIDDNRADIRVPSAADMLELVQHFQTVTKVTFNSASVLSNGNRRLVYTEETDGTAGPKATLEVPSVLELGIAPFEDCEPYVVKARFRYRVQSGDLLMGFILDNAADVRRDAVKTVVEKVQKELGITVMRGTPSS
jgi:uncharacterized protein YfdQ (DUF2303 family)